MNPPNSKPSDNEMTHPTPHLQPYTNTQLQTQDEDDHVEKNKKNTCINKSSLISLEGNYQSNVKLYL